jgi:hypothetical protein
MKEKIKWFLIEYWYPLLLLTGIITCIVLINSILTSKPKEKTCCTSKELTAQINEIEYYDYVPAKEWCFTCHLSPTVDFDSYGIDEIPTIP